MNKNSTNGDVIEIRGEEVILKQGESIVMRVSLTDFVKYLALEQPRSVFSDGSPIPDSVRYIYMRGNATLVVVELFPQVRQVRWISADSKIRHGEGSRYDSVNLAFPFIVIPILFQNGCLCNCQQLFYRTSPLKSEGNELFLPNLLNVMNNAHFISWLCLKNMPNVSELRMGRQIQSVIEHFWASGFNESAGSEGSYFTKQRANLDPRIRSLESWQRATEQDPMFMLNIRWKSTGMTLQEVVESMLLGTGRSGTIKTASDLVSRICAIPSSQPMPIEGIEDILNNLFM